MEVYVDFLDSKNGFLKTRRDFKTYALAWAWILETFDNPSHEFICYY